MQIAFNRDGANGMIATEAVAKAPKDGYIAVIHLRRRPGCQPVAVRKGSLRRGRKTLPRSHKSVHLDFS